MVARVDTVYLDGLDFFTAAVVRVQPSDWQRPTPCAGWRAVDMVGHVGAATRFGTRLLLGEAPDWEPVEPPGSVVDGDPATWWRRLVEPARAAVRAVDLTRMVDSPMGRRSVGDGLTFPAIDLFVHGWDLGRSVGVDLEIPAAAMEFARAVLQGLPDEQVRSPRVFGAEVQPQPDATPSRRFIAWTGRDPRWTA